MLLLGLVAFDYLKSYLTASDIKDPQDKSLPKMDPYFMDVYEEFGNPSFNDPLAPKYYMSITPDLGRVSSLVPPKADHLPTSGTWQDDLAFGDCQISGRRLEKLKEKEKEEKAERKRKRYKHDNLVQIHHYAFHWLREWAFVPPFKVTRCIPWNDTKDADGRPMSEEDYHMYCRMSYVVEDLWKAEESLDEKSTEKTTTDISDEDDMSRWLYKPPDNDCYDHFSMLRRFFRWTFDYITGG